MAENFMRLLVVAVANVGDSDKDFKGILVIGFTDSAFDIAFYFGLPFFTVSKGGSGSRLDFEKENTHVVKPNSFL